MICDDLRLGGTLSSSGITGATSINSTALHIYDWRGLFGTPGINAANLEVNGIPGAMLAGDQLGSPRLFNLNVSATRYGPTGIGSLVEASEAEQVEANTDDFLDLVTTPETYLEVELADGSKRYLTVTNLDPAYTNYHQLTRRWTIPLASDWPYWRQSASTTETVSGATSFTVAGKKTVYDATLVFAGDGTFTHSDLGWAIEVTGSSNPVTVKLGPPPRTVVESGSPALNRIRRTVVEGMGRIWGWFPTGINNVTSTVSVDVTYRPQWV